MTSATETVPDSTPTAVACAHCGLPSPPPSDVSQPAFCCEGCRGAYLLIHGWGLEDYYALRDRVGGEAAVQPVESPGRFDELDDPSAMGLSAPRACGEGLLVSRLGVSGLHCGACAWLIERSASHHRGFQAARVRFHDHTVEIFYRPDETRLSRIAKDLARLGYRVAPMTDDDRQRRQSSENRRLLIDIALAGFCMTNAMWLAVALYAGESSGIAAEHESALRIAGVTLGVVSVAVPGRTFLRGALASLRTRTPHMDLPVALGISVGALAGVVVVLVGRGEVYFDSVTMLVFFLLIGRWLQFRQQRRASDSVSLLMRLTPRLATQVGRDGMSRRVPADRLAAGDTIRVAAGETFAADGVVSAGRSAVDRSLVTGESHPVEVSEGDPVEAGASNLEATLDVCVTASGGESRVGRITRMIEDAAGRRAPLVQLADAIGGRFVVTVLILAAVTVAIWWRSDPIGGVENAVALLIVACPCALALATPLSLAVAIGRMAQRRMLVRGGDVVERLSRPGFIWFDKTGTLTEGRLRLRSWSGDPETLAAAAAVEASLSHPVAVAIRNAAEQRGYSVPAADQVRQRSGMGAQGQVGSRRVLVGNEELMRSEGIGITAARQAEIAQISAGGLAPLLVAIDGQIRGVGGIGDHPRPSAADAVARLVRRGWGVGILSGDHPEVVRRVAESLGIPSDRAFGAMEPEAKLAKVEASLGSGGPIVMVGDGVNDAAALAAADVGVAVRGGAAASLDAAPVYLQTDGPSALVDLVDASRQTVRTIRRNFFLSLGYNSVAVTLAMSGLIHPLMAAILMPLSSLTVISSVLVSKTFR